MYLRAVIDECSTWQKSVSKFLQDGLKDANLDKSLFLGNSNELISILKVNQGTKCSVLSLQIKDLFYSLEKNRLMKRGTDALKCNLVQFRFQTAISTDSLGVIREYYHQSTVVGYEETRLCRTKACALGPQFDRL